MAMTALAAAAIAGPIVGSIVGNVASSGDRKRAREAAAAATAELMRMGMPPDMAREIVYKEFQKAGTLTPEMEQEINLGVSEVAQIQEDPSLRNAQTSALNILAQKGQTGFSPEDQAALNAVRDEINREAQAKQQTIMQNFQQRGMGGAGAELAAQLMEAQGSSNRMSREGIDVAGAASQRALEAMRQSAALGGDIRGQDFNVANTKASAKDQFQRFNVENQMARQQRNVNSRNQAQEFNLNNAQDIANRNVMQHNNEQVRQREGLGQNWDREMQLRTARANVLNGQAANYNSQAQQTAQMWSGTGSGIGAGAGSAMKYMGDKKPTNNTIQVDAEHDPDKLKRIGSTA
jgi:hypothetical protein